MTAFKLPGRLPGRLAGFCLFAALAAALCTAGGPAAAQDAEGTGTAQEASGSGILALLPDSVKTDHTIRIAGRTLSYTAEAGTLKLLGGDGATTAKIFYTAYTATGQAGSIPADTAGDSTPPAEDERPVTFVFNGGPGAASAYLHIGGLGPRVLATGADGAFLPAPQHLVDNPDTWLAMSDLVFVDPVGTGYSRAAPGKKARDFWSVDADAASMGAFIRLFLQHTGRTGAPVYLAGESYGGFRAALLAKTLQDDNGIAPRGVVLISPALEFTFVYPDDFQPLNDALNLPAMAAVNLANQGVAGTDLEKQLADVERYAMGGYLTALAGGLESGGRSETDAVARITGLPRDVVARHFARVPLSVFARKAERDAGRVLSRYDGTIATADIAPASDRSRTPDPLLDRSVPVITAPFVDYLRTDLNYRTPVSYRLLNHEVGGRWDYGTSASRQGYAGVMDDLQEARALNPDLAVLIVNGYTDLITPYPVSRYLVDQLPRLAGARAIETRVYPGGHMMYLRPASRHALKRDAAHLYEPGP